MVTAHESLALLKEPVAQALLQSSIPARLAYLWTDGTPRVVPIWFHWTGEAFVLTTLPLAPKLNALVQHPQVALTIDSNTWPYQALNVRGSVTVERLDTIVPEFVATARRYLGAAQSEAFVEHARKAEQGLGRITLVPSWVGLLDFQTRWPSAWSA
jgi:hypothetical protein